MEARLAWAFRIRPNHSTPWIEGALRLVKTDGNEHRHPAGEQDHFASAGFDAG